MAARVFYAEFQNAEWRIPSTFYDEREVSSPHSGFDVDTPIDSGFSLSLNRSQLHPGSVSAESPEKIAEFLRNLSLTLLSVSYKYLRKTEELSAFTHNRYS